MPLVRNLTPFELVVSPQRRGAAAYDAAPFETVEVPNGGPPSEHIYVQCRGGNLDFPIGAIPAAAPDQTVSITVDQLRSSSDYSRGFTRIARTFKNSTTEMVDLILAAANPSRQATLYPGDEHVADTPYAQLWVVRSVFTGQIVAAFMDDDKPGQREIIYDITDDYTERLAEHVGPPSPLPGDRPVVLIGGTRETPPPEDRAYISIDNRDGPFKPMFNGRENVVTRRVKIIGAKLIWDAHDNKYGLMSLQGRKVLDLESLEMVADEVIIASPLRLPGTNVSIHARRVQFANDGIIDTSPPELEKVEFTGPKTPAKEAPKVVKDGAAGPPGGSVTLIAQRLVTGDTGTIRIRTQGGKGGAAEPGRLLAYTRRDTHLPNTQAPEASANRAVVLQDDIAGRLPEWFTTLGSDAKYLSGWLWPGGQSEPGKCVYGGKALGLGAGNSVTSLLISAHDNRWGGLDMNWFRFPGAKHEDMKWHLDGVYWDANRFTSYSQTPTVLRPVPGDGADAYAGGQPGDGGAAGRVWTNIVLRDVVEKISDLRGGDAGPPTAKVDGGPPGTPEVALLVDMAIVRTGSSGPAPKMWVEEYRAKPGKSGEAKTAKPGANGEVQIGGGGGQRAEAVDAVLAYARAAFRDGNRKDAQRAIEPYVDLFRSPLLARNTRLTAQIIAVNAMRENLLANVDYFGNPPGWLPRMRVSTNLELFDTIRKASYQLLYFATTTEQKFDDLANRAALATEIRSALENETLVCRRAISAATTQLAEARLEMAKIVNDLGTRQQDLDKLKNFAELDALSRHEKQRIFKGVMQLVGGAMQAIPVGQPYLGAGGGLISGIGEIDFFTSDKPADRAAEALTKLGEVTDSFLEENTDLLSAKLAADLHKKVKLEKKNVKSLGAQVTQANGEAGQIEENVEEYTKEIEDRRVKDLDARRDNLVLEKSKIEETIAEFGSDVTPEDIIKEVKVAPAPKSPKVAALQHDLLDLTTSLGNVDAEIAEAKEGDAKANAKRLVRLKLEQYALTDAKVRVEKLQAQKDDADAKVEQAEEKAGSKQEKYAEAMGRLKSMGTGISGIGAGIAALATPASRDDEGVKSMAAKMLKTVDPKQYQQLIKDMSQLDKNQAEAIEKLTKAQAIINSNVARLAESLNAQASLGCQLQSLDGVLNARAKQYLSGMRQRAEDMLHSSMYYLVMSYRYEALMDLPDTFVNYDRIVAALQVLGKAPTVSKPGPPTNLKEAAEQLQIDMTNPSEDDLKKFDDMVQKFEFLTLGVEIANKRQSRAVPRSNSAKLALRPEQRSQLHQLRSVTINLVRDFAQSKDYSWTDARIAELTLTKVRFKSPDPIVNMRVEFHHSGESIIRSSTSTGNPVYYYFRAARNDDPIAWTFAATATSDDGSDDDASDHVMTPTVTRDSAADVEDAFLSRALDSAKITFQEYWPSLFSDITVKVDWDDVTVDEITELSFEIRYTKGQ